MCATAGCEARHQFGANRMTLDTHLRYAYEEALEKALLHHVRLLEAKDKLRGETLDAAQFLQARLDNNQSSIRGMLRELRRMDDD